MTQTDLIKGLFPLKGKVTKAILKEANVRDIHNCIGAVTLRKALGEHLFITTDIQWGDYYGILKVDGQWVRITTEGRIAMMDIKKSTEVTFILRQD